MIEVLIFLFCSAFNPDFVASFAVFLSKSELSIIPEILDLSINSLFYLFNEHFNRKFIKIY